MQPIGNKILSRIYGKGRGWTFTPKAFDDITDRKTVAVILGRLVKRGIIRRLARGLYDHPKIHPELGPLHPSPETIARTIAGKNKIRLQPSGAYAANLLGLSEQVPAKVVFLTDGETSKVVVGRLTIELRRTAPRHMAAAGRSSGLVIQALRFLGKDNVNSVVLKKLSKALPTASKKEILKDLDLAPAWMRPILTQVAHG